MNYILEFKEEGKKWDRFSFDNDLSVMEKRFEYAEAHRPATRMVRLSDEKGNVIKETVVA